VTRIGLGTNRLTNTREHIAFPKEAVAAGVSHIDTAHTQGPSDLRVPRRQRQFLGLAAPTTVRRRSDRRPLATIATLSDG
jgi:diketogulonate reductase-like aldo/keto reductase